MDFEYEFGYPKICERCRSVGEENPSLTVRPYYRQGEGSRLMLIGQDPTIYKKPERVTTVLMLDKANGQLKRWLRDLIGIQFDSLTVYATNLVKCSFSKPPSTTVEGGLKFIRPYFNNCKVYLEKELLRFKPDCVLTLGEPAHRLLISMFSDLSPIPAFMKEAFTGRFFKVQYNGIYFDYSPCLHIKTFRVAEKYGTRIQQFQTFLKSYFA
jgi:uracil-DNA glycosylase